jgi:hypothetical protein
MAFPDPAPRDPAPRDPARRGTFNAVRALTLYFVYVLAFIVGGGIGAGVPAFVYNGIATDAGDSMDSDPNFILYAVMFGVTGWIAYKLAQRLMEGDYGYDRR